MQTGSSHSKIFKCACAGSTTLSFPNPKSESSAWNVIKTKLINDFINVAEHAKFFISKDFLFVFTLIPGIETGDFVAAHILVYFFLALGINDLFANAHCC